MNEDCLKCGGACCRFPWDIVFDPDEGVPEEYTNTYYHSAIDDDGIEVLVFKSSMKKKNNGFECVCLKDGHCTIYEQRPSTCHFFEVGCEECRTVRRKIGNG